jgi:hypothetical protein
MPEGARRFAVASAVGAVVALAVFFTFHWVGSPGFFDTPPFGLGGFYDNQARALFRGHWDAGPDAFPIERVKLDDRYYMYFGPWPSLLRMPILLVTSRFDGGLTRLSLLVGGGVLLVAAGRVLWQVRSLCGRVGQPSRRELAGVAAFVFVVGCGSTVVFLSGAGWVYDEAILWGTAWALWSLHAGIAHLLAPSHRTLVLTAVFSTFAVTSRVSSGAVGISLLGSLFVLQLLATRRRSSIRGLGSRLADVAGVDGAAVRRSPWPAAVASVTPLLAYVAVNWAKFRTILTVPFDKQDAVRVRVPQRSQVLLENGNDLVALDQIPSNLLHYLRPDGFSLDRLFPFVDFTDTIRNVGGVAREPEGPTASFTTTTTLLLILAVVGLAIVLVPAIARGANASLVRSLRVPILAATMAFVPTLVFPAAAERYKADLTPLLVLSSAIGLYGVASWLRRGSRRRRVLVGVAAILAAANVWTNLALTLNFQRAYQVRSGADRGAYILDRIRWTERLGVEPSADFVEWERGSVAPQPAPRSVGTFLVVDGCSELLLSDGDKWLELGFDDRRTCEALGFPIDA